MDDEDLAKLFSVLAKYFPVPTKVSYAEAPGAPIKVATIIKHRWLVQELQLLQPNLSFSQTDMRLQLQRLASQRKASWNFTLEDIENFSVQMAKRIRTMCRHVSQSQRRAKLPKWVENYFNPPPAGQLLGGPPEPEAGDVEGKECDEGEECGPWWAS